MQIDWGADAQVSLDILRGLQPLPGHGANHKEWKQARSYSENLKGIEPPQLADQQMVPVFATNPDFVFAGEYQIPRLAQGAFIETLKVSQLWYLYSHGRCIRVRCVSRCRHCIEEALVKS